MSTTSNPTSAPTTMIEKIENLSYLIMGVSTLCVLGFTLHVWNHMPPYQREKIKFSTFFSVAFAWFDFIGDVTWTWQRFYEYYVRREGKLQLNFGIASVIVLATSTIYMSCYLYAELLSHLRYDRRYGVVDEKILKMGKVVQKHKNDEEPDNYRIGLPSFLLLQLIACTDPDIITLFPWAEEMLHHSPPENKQLKAFLTERNVKISLVKMYEDIPELILQITYWSYGNFSVFNLMNLLSTVVVMYIGRAKFVEVAEPLETDDLTLNPQKKGVQPIVSLSSLGDEELAKSMQIVNVEKDIYGRPIVNVEKDIYGRPIGNVEKRASRSQYQYELYPEYQLAILICRIVFGICRMLAILISGIVFAICSPQEFLAGLDFRVRVI
jgi:hypothetical protein